MNFEQFVRGHLILCPPPPPNMGDTSPVHPLIDAHETSCERESWLEAWTPALVGITFTDSTHAILIARNEAFLNICVKEPVGNDRYRRLYTYDKRWSFRTEAGPTGSSSFNINSSQKLGNFFNQVHVYDLLPNLKYVVYQWKAEVSFFKMIPHVQ